MFHVASFHFASPRIRAAEEKSRRGSQLSAADGEGILLQLVQDCLRADIAEQQAEKRGGDFAGLLEDLACGGPGWWRSAGRCRTR
jgi:hypothetical protein